MGVRSRWLCVGVGLFACQPAADGEEDPSESGPSLRVESVVPSGDADHLAELVRHGDAYFVSGSNDAFTVVGLEVDGGLELLLDHVPGGSVRCTTIDVYADADVLLCADEAHGRVYPFSIADPAAPVLTTPLVLDEPLAVADLHVWGDALWIGAYRDGLWRSALGADGTPSQPERVAEPGNVRIVQHSGEDLVLLAIDRGLVRLHPDGATWVEGSVTAIDGPAISMRVRDDRAVVSMGSAGAQVFDLSVDPPQPTARVRPPGVATAADVRGPILAVSTLTGLFTYDLEAGPERPFGFVRSGARDHVRPGSMLDVEFAGDTDLLVSDWNAIRRVRVDPAGEIRDIDARNGLYLGSDTPFSLSVRNLSAHPWRATLRVVDETLGEFDLEADAVSELELADDVRDLHFAPGSLTEIEIEIRDHRGELIDAKRVGVLRVENAHDPSAEGKPAPGETFPELWLGKDGQTPLVLPLDQTAFRAVFFTEDCMAMWPELQDVAWLSARGKLDGGATPVLVATGAVFGAGDEDSIGARLGLYGAEYGSYEGLPPEFAQHNVALEPIYAHGFALEQLESAAAHPTDYLVDAQGRVVAVEREYRGLFGLRGP